VRRKGAKRTLPWKLTADEIRSRYHLR
jgi:hypothetical protein